MAWLFFIDESGHDHKTTPYEVRGGFAIHVSKLWPLVQEMQKLEMKSFGCRIQNFRKEIKGSTLIDRKRHKFAEQLESFEAVDRQHFCRSFFSRSQENSPPTHQEFAAYGQACRHMALGTFRLLRSHEAVLFASAIPCGATRPPGHQIDFFLRKDIVFLLERFYYFLEEKKEHGILVMDETDKRGDQKFVSKIERYFTKTGIGRTRSEWIVPTPLFVSSDMTSAIQAADLCIYCVNWGFRLPERGMNAPKREEIAAMFVPELISLQYRGLGYRDNQAFETYGVVYVPDPYEPRGLRPDRQE